MVGQKKKQKQNKTRPLKDFWKVFCLGIRYFQSRITKPGNTNRGYNFLAPRMVSEW